MIRILIVDDSITQREILRKVLEADDQFVVVGEGRDGACAVQMVKQCGPDVVLMDVHMPEVDGIEATRRIMSECPVPVVIVSATLRKRDIDHGMAGLEAGAVAIVQKPKGAALLHLKKIGPELRAATLAASQARVEQRSVAVPGARRVPATVTRTLAPVEVVGVCTSTGGPPALVELFSSLPNPFPIPILLVQHISEAFVEGFATWLGARCGQTTRIADDFQRLEPGVWLAPPGRHLTLGSRTRIKLLPRAAGDIHCPSGDPLFASLATHFGPKAIGVQLTGMGDDGAKGLLALKLAGGQILIQSEASCMIYGMPKAAKQLCASQREYRPAEIAGLLSRLVL